MLKYHGTPIEELLEEQMREDFYHFEGNAQALRLVSKLHFLVDENGMNLTYALLNTIINIRWHLHRSGQSPGYP